MSTTPCDKLGPGKCTPAPSSSDDETLEGQWVGIGLAILLTILIVSWLARTCSNKTRRQRALHKFCCRPKPAEKDNGTSEYDSVTGAGLEGSQAPIYYHPTSPSAQQEVGKDSPRPVRHENGHAHVPPDPEDPAAISARNRHLHAVHTLGLKKCRTSSASALSLTLAPIQEDAADPRTGSQPHLPSAAEEIHATPSRSQSHPARLTALPDRHLNGGPHWHLGAGGGELEEANDVKDLLCKLKQLDETLSEADDEEVTNTDVGSAADRASRTKTETVEPSNFTSFSLGGEELSQSQRPKVTDEMTASEV